MGNTSKRNLRCNNDSDVGKEIISLNFELRQEFTNGKYSFIISNSLNGEGALVAILFVFFSWYRQ